MLLHEERSINGKQAATLPQGHILKGRYSDVLRSEKGKVKGIRLQTSDQEYAVKLPKYLRPMLVRELELGAFIQVWAYPDGVAWDAVNILPLPPSEVDALGLGALPTQASQMRSSRTCVQVCRKGSCCKRGSGELWRALQQEVETNPEFQEVDLEATGCLKACKQGPNLRLPSTGEVISWASPKDAPAVLAHISKLARQRTQYGLCEIK
ncbi:(2Fe-2S) ferredoxin domain-containing protein [Pseudanabaena sp. FACHB-2040]|uniref:(2Fe-2S) ferredoxin domain-containing protein n=1 Tax=Pseudanabaena sp. FACHB-2040 TaxID=2692859 RepID=UPI001683A6E3|nr:(2Fe-2S) ferredoxin domain-containing protein [Pseudanabaena sp. FACHB-2040]